MFCLEEEIEDVEGVLKVIMEERGKSKAPCVFPLEELLFYIEDSMKKAQKRLGFTPEKGKFFINADMARNTLKSELFKFQVVPCKFHEETGRVDYCSQAILRQRAFIIMDRLCDQMGTAMIRGVHTPNYDPDSVGKNEKCY